VRPWCNPGTTLAQPWCNPAQGGLLEKYGVELIGAKLPSINKAEDRELFKQAMKKIGLKTPPSGTVETWEDALKARAAPLRPVAAPPALVVCSWGPLS
jgi:carbamoylphosphate synthase large subunit